VAGPSRCLAAARRVRGVDGRGERRARRRGRGRRLRLSGGVRVESSAGATRVRARRRWDADFPPERCGRRSDVTGEGPEPRGGSRRALPARAGTARGRGWCSTGASGAISCSRRRRRGP
jgi:hypothetical protein